jgi:hypothetical protein
MREVAGAILILAGSVLVAAGVIAEAITKGHDGYGNLGYVLGAIAALAGIVMLSSGGVRRAWDAIPTDAKSPDRTGSGAAGGP